MPETKSSPDWFARVTALIAIFLTSISLCLAYYNYSWQTKTYKEGLEERILVRLGFSQTVKDTESFSLSAKGDVGVEVVNIGMHPIYLKQVEIEVPDRRIFSFYERDPIKSFYKRDPIKSSVPAKSLEPGEATNYTLEWDFSTYPLQEWLKTGKLQENLWVQVDTTKKAFRQHPLFSWFVITETIPQMRGSKK